MLILIFIAGVIVGMAAGVMLWAFLMVPWGGGAGIDLDDYEEKDFMEIPQGN